MYLCISTVVDFISQNFDPPLMKFDYLDHKTVRKNIASFKTKGKQTLVATQIRTERSSSPVHLFCGGG